MKKHPLSTGCAYVMLVALIVFGVAGLALKFADDLPVSWAPMVAQAQTAIIVSLAAAFVAATIASMRSAWHAERAHQAGKGFAHIMWLAIGYTTVCIIIEVAIGKLGAAMIGLDVPTLALTALLVFFAIAPRIVAVILSGLDGLARAEVKADDNVEHTRTLERIEAAGRASSQRIQAGVSNLDQERVARKLGGGALIGAAAALMAGGGAPAEAAMTYPTTEAPVVSTVSTPRVNEEAALMPVGPQHQKAYARMIEILEQNPSLSNRRLGRAISVSHPTIKVWRRHYRAQQALAFSGNAGLLDAA